VPKPAYAINTGSKRKSYHTESRNLMIGDEIALGESWSALVGLNHTTIDTRNYNPGTGALTSAYKKSDSTPTASLLFKPRPNVTVYASYLEALEQGGVAPDTYLGQPVLNAGRVFAPFVDKQYEIGVKTHLGETFLTAALFKIDKANQYVDSDSLLYVQDGRQVHKGIELTATGSVRPGLRVYGGIHWLRARVIENSNTPELEGKRPTSVPARQAKLFVEYDIPGVRGLTWTAGALHAGSYMYNAQNTLRMPAVTTYETGLRYRTGVADHPLTVRLNVTNVTDKRYWLGNIPGDPRVVSLSATMGF
jgi:iron complex outermembrane receptor protein